MAPSETMLESAAYRRMKAENPSEFVPRSVFFARDGGSGIDRRNSLWVKAALVYESVTGRHVDDGAKPLATSLLLALARACGSSHLHPPPQQAEGATDVLNSPTSDAGAGGGDVESEEKKTAAELPHDDDDDEGTDEEKRVIDAVFLVVGFLTRLVKAAEGVSRDAVDEGFKSTHMQDIVTDVIKLENQLPLDRILGVVGRVQSAVRHVAATDARFEGLRERLQGYQLGFTAATFFDDVVRPFCWYYSPFSNKQLPAVDRAAQHDDDRERTLLDFLHATVVPAPPGAEKGAAGGGKTSRMPTARELSRSGVRIAPGEDGRAAVEFDEASARLQLPALVYDFKLATVARNLLAREYQEQNKPVTRYFQMMKELVDEAADAKILHRAGAVRGGGASGAEVHELVKRIHSYATYPSVFMAMDVQIEKVRRFHDKRMQNFLVRYRPGVIWASSVAAVSLVAIVAARRRG
ncbi:hypothetical protein D1007_14483 [Hordeum vulgare]|uniref:Uncharacterized protein n=1 Tax=Hordeum vulgare subsp. vulgare TaxID=112509 RepID=A0A8I6YZU1_HORVV|nr:uncharacterized protein LOC123411218 [Hordeum vulgare subsp. vulgare]KAE8809045.1 hypothetical protein D1007_14483 [Hordeum vulgare]